jgi:hypothetical protein
MFIYILCLYLIFSNLIVLNQLKPLNFTFKYPKLVILWQSVPLHKVFTLEKMVHDL